MLALLTVLALVTLLAVLALLAWLALLTQLHERTICVSSEYAHTRVLEYSNYSSRRAHLNSEYSEYSCARSTRVLVRAECSSVRMFAINREPSRGDQLGYSSWQELCVTEGFAAVLAELFAHQVRLFAPFA